MQYFYKRIIYWSIYHLFFTLYCSSIIVVHDILLDVSSKNEIVLDCFGGSDSTLLAAERCKRRARHIEISPKYVDVTIYRWEKESGKTTKFVRNFAEVNDGE